MLINEYLPKLKQLIGKKAYNRARYFYIFINENAEVTSVFVTYYKNINSQKGSEIFDFPHEKLEVTDEYVGKKSYHRITTMPLTIESFML